MEKENDDKANSGGIDYSGLGIGLTDIGELKIEKVRKIDMITSKSKTSILFSFYLNIIILSKLTMY